jgi:Rrf2 family transcriptional regulator, iron-sulfur cluster assembly transcription factor
LFKIKKKIIYAIEAVVDIALNSGPDPVRNEAIAKRQGIPKRYLEQTLQILVKNKILVGSRGPKGGYSLARERRKIKISEIVKSVSREDRSIEDLNSSLSQNIIMPMIKNVTHKCLNDLGGISVEEICKIVKDKKTEKINPEKVDFVI